MHVSRSRFYYKPRGESQANMDLMKQMDEILLEHPTTGVRMFVDIFRLQGLKVNHKHVSRLMKVMGVKCIYTSEDWMSCLKKHHIRISMDGRGRCKDYIWIERFWPTIKQEYIYLNLANDGYELRKGIAGFIEYYNYRRAHHSLPELLPYRRYSRAA